MTNPVRTPDGFARRPAEVKTAIPVIPATSPYDWQSADDLLLAGGGGPVTINMPSARKGGVCTIQHNDALANNVTLVPETGEAVSGGSPDLVLNANGTTSFQATKDVAGVGLYTWIAIA